MIKYPLNVTIDSNVFDANKYDLAEDSTLSLLISYVEKHKIKVILSNIVVNEISKHIQNKAYEIAAVVNNMRKDVMKSYPENLIRNVDVEYILTKVDRKEMAQKAKVELNAFLDKLDLEILDSSAVDVEKIFSDYFEFKPPFEDNDKKRKEFPDAFAAAQIKKRFNNGEKLAIVSADKGFKKACGNSSNYIFFDSLGELYDTLNKVEENYNKSVAYIDNLSYVICERIKDIIWENDCVDVIGVSYDKDGVQDGYDYSETMVEYVSNVSSRIHTIDEISEEHVSATLVCSADIDVDCYYEDYNNAAWDSESKSYFYVETKAIKEIHTARFGVRVEINVKSGEFKLSKFTVRLGGDSRKDRFEIPEEEDYDYEQDIRDMDRKSVGLLALGEYESYLEDSLVDSKMKEDFVNQFEAINTLLSGFEEVSMIYDEIMEQIKNTPDEAKKIMLKIAENTEDIKDFPIELDKSEITNEDVDEFYLWMEEKYLEIIKFADKERLPDNIEFGNQISFSDANENIYTLSLDEIQICPSEGDEEYINICLSNSADDEMCKGYVKLTVGYMDFDEDGGVSDGLGDDVEYYYNEIIKGIDNVIESLKELLDGHNKLRGLLENFL